MNKQNILIKKAFLEYKSLGLDPLPIPYVNNLPTKGPRVEGWQEHAVNPGYTESDFAQPCNIGVLLGSPHNLTDIDCDSIWTTRAAGFLFADTDPFMIFGRDGKPNSHYFFFADESLPSVKIKHPIKNPKTNSHECIIEYRCVKGDGTRGNQTVFPPSIWYKDGKEEHITESHRNPESKPMKARTLMRITKYIAAVALLAEYFPGKGSRHETILALAGWMARGGISEEKAKVFVGGAYGISAGYNNDLRKAESDVSSVYDAHSKGGNAHLYGFTKLKDIYPVEVLQFVSDLLGLKKPESTTTTTTSGKHYTLTDTGLGLRFVDSCGEDFRYVVEPKSWYVWDGSVWVEDHKQIRREKAKRIGAQIRAEADAVKVADDEDTANKAIKKALNAHANYAESVKGIDALLKAASSDRRIVSSLSEFDQHPDLLNVKNGVLDLRTGDLRAHDRSLMLTQIAPTDYKPMAVSHEFDQALETWTKNHPDLKPYLQRLYGYSITGTKHEEKVVIMHGPGGTGKGTFFSLIGATLGTSFVKTAASSTFVDRKRAAGSASPDIERMDGARIIVCSEIEKGTKLAEGFTKLLSGNDVITTRGLFQAEREFHNKGQLFFQTNFRPAIDSNDSGNRRRYIEIPFDNQMKPDKRMKDRLLRSVEVREAMLAWLVAGAVEYFRDGLGSCDSVEAATQEFFDSNDSLGGFLKGSLVRESGAKITRATLLENYISWCAGEGEKPMDAKNLYAAMRERGFDDKTWKVDDKPVRGFLGVREKTEYDLFRKTQPQPQFEIDTKPEVAPTVKPKRNNLAAQYAHLKSYCPSQDELDEEFGLGSGKTSYVEGEYGHSHSTLDMSKYQSVFNKRLRGLAVQ